MTMLERTNTVEKSAPKHAARARLTVLIAAHNEEECIGATLDSILAQERRIDHIVVAADNCTDRTVEIAQSRQAEAGPALIVFETVANTRKKPGALNQAWALTREHSDLFVCIDADTVLPSDAVGDVGSRVRPRRRPGRLQRQVHHAEHAGDDPSGRGRDRAGQRG